MINLLTLVVIFSQILYLWGSFYSQVLYLWGGFYSQVLYLCGSFYSQVLYLRIDTSLFYNCYGM